MDPRLDTTPRHPRSAADIPLWQSSLPQHAQSKNKNLRTPKSEALSSAAQNVVKVNGCLENKIIQNNGSNDSRPQEHTKACMPSIMPKIFISGQSHDTDNSSSSSSSSSMRSSTKISEFSRSPSATSMNASSSASQPTTVNTTVFQQAALKDCTRSSSATPDPCTACLPESTSQSNTSNFGEHAPSTRTTKMSDQIYASDDYPSIMISSSESSVPRPEDPNSSLPVDLTAGTTIVSEMTASKFNSLVQRSSNDSVSHSRTASRSNTASESNPRTTNLPSATSSDHDQLSLIHCKPVAKNCFVELELPLPPDLEHEWDRKICNQLSDDICRAVNAEVTVECVMARSTSSGEVKPTILLMCLKTKHKKQLKEILRGCNYIPKHFRKKVALLANQRRTPGNISPKVNTLLQDQKIAVEIAIDGNRAKSVVFGSLARFQRINDAKFTAFSTIGGVILIEGVSYGLTTAHGIHTVSNPPPEATRFSGTSSHSSIQLIVHLLTC